SVTQSGRNVKISGVAQSSTRVSSYMRNVNESGWLENPFQGHRPRHARAVSAHAIAAQSHIIEPLWC
ncbi:MAG: PilN domain-containing protein, partial [Pseudomonadota bacterium]